MIRKALLLLLPFAVMSACDQATPTAPAANDVTPQLARSAPPGQGGALGTVYVSSQGLYYDTFVSADELPMRGRFQLLEDGVTEFGPGDPGYLGGRWWVDANDNGIQDEEDVFLLCPLLGRPGVGAGFPPVPHRQSSEEIPKSRIRRHNVVRLIPRISAALVLDPPAEASAASIALRSSASSPARYRAPAGDSEPSGSLTEAGRCWASTRPPPERIAELSTTLNSSRTFPGQS
jgi:hypothetical protein